MTFASVAQWQSRATYTSNIMTMILSVYHSMKRGEKTPKTARIIELAQSGLSVTQIAKETGFTFRSVFDTIKRHSVKTSSGKPDRIDWKAIQSYYDAGYSVRECLKHFEISEAGFYRAARRGEIKTRSLQEGLRLSISSGRRKKYEITPEHREKLSQGAKDRGLGGDRPTDKFEYKGFKLCSSYELRVAICLDAVGLEWIKPKTRFDWDDSTGKRHRYSPDLYIPSLHVYLDPKNDYCIQRDTDKIDRVRNQNSVDVRIIPIEMIEAWESDHGLVIKSLSAR